MKIDITIAAEHIRSKKYSEEELDEILDVFSHAFNLTFKIIDSSGDSPYIQGIKKSMTVRWKDELDDSDFLNDYVKTYEYSKGLNNVFGNSTKYVKELMIIALYGNTLYRAGFDFNELITDEFIPICDVPTFDSISELKMKLAITNG